MTVHRIGPGSRMSQGTVANGLLYVSGQVAADKSLDVAGQTLQVLHKIEAIMAEAGATKSGLLAVTLLLPHMTDLPVVSAVYESWIARAAPPARACIEARLANSGIKVEIAAICAVETS